MDFSVVLVGAGNMGGAMLRGWIAGGLSPSRVIVLDPNPSEAMRTFIEEAGITSRGSPDGIASPDVLLVAIKPQMMENVLPTLQSLGGDKTVVVSVAAGTTIAYLVKCFPKSTIVRSMPNTPSLVGRGITVACPDSRINEVQCKQVSQLLSATGKLEWVMDEKLIDAVTAVSGSGPAYVFHLAECMAEAGKAAGLPDALADKLARETVCGAGELMFQSSDTPDVLRKNVTSPGGTTAAALEVLMKEDGMPRLLNEAIKAAKKRSEELS